MKLTKETLKQLIKEELAVMEQAQPIDARGGLYNAIESLAAATQDMRSALAEGQETVELERIAEEIAAAGTAWMAAWEEHGTSGTLTKPASS